MLRGRCRLRAETSPDAIYNATPLSRGGGTSRAGGQPALLSMLSDLDRLMAERAIEAIVVPMHEAMHPSFRWLARGAKVTRGYAIKIVERDPVLVTYPMERDEAAASGLRTILVHELGYDRIFRSAPNPAAGYAELFDVALRGLGVRESVAFLGNLPFHLYLDIAEEMTARGWRVHHSRGEDLIQLARKRKEAWEIEAVRSVGERTEEVVGVVRRMLGEGRPLKLGDLKEVVSFEIARRGMVEDHETILSQGRDAGIPHSRGNPGDPVLPSVPIVLDIFPSDRSSGYFFDLTRTFCVGPVPEELARIHADVRAAFDLAAEQMKPGTRASSYQALVCDFFEAKGYSTTRANPATMSGYVHSLGHGVGLEVHEKPFFGLMPSNNDMIEVDDIVTIEPGLYFPERAIGVRIEDTFVVRENGVETLCRSDYGLEP
jgi:Xaa-Pro aminopeptidase